MNAWILDFADRLTYSKHDEITIEIFLSGNSSIPVAVVAKVDIGSKFCMFQPRYADVLGFDLQTGLRQSIRTPAGSFTAYGHEITLTAGDMEWDTIVYFAEPESFPINVVGRVGFFDHLQVGLVDYEQLLYLSPYNPA
ncbi:MAG: hypothetical protein ACJ74G_07250 [Blastocatellia bacterium]